MYGSFESHIQHVCVFDYLVHKAFALLSIYSLVELSQNTIAVGIWGKSVLKIVREFFYLI